MLTVKELYDDEGSKCCQQYSELTMQTCSFAQHILIAYAVGVGLALTRVGEWPPPYLGALLSGGGVILIAFGVVLWILNQHHSTAFRAIRDKVLVPLEEAADGNPPGPWMAHQAERRQHFVASWFAWHFPFVVLVILGLVSMILGAMIWTPIGA